MEKGEILKQTLDLEPVKGSTKTYKNIVNNIRGQLEKAVSLNPQKQIIQVEYDTSKLQVIPGSYLEVKSGSHTFKYVKVEDEDVLSSSEEVPSSAHHHQTVSQNAPPVNKRSTQPEVAHEVIAPLGHLYQDVHGLQNLSDGRMVYLNISIAPVSTDVELPNAHTLNMKVVFSEEPLHPTINHVHPSQIEKDAPYQSIRNVILNVMSNASLNLKLNPHTGIITKDADGVVSVSGVSAGPMENTYGIQPGAEYVMKGAHVDVMESTPSSRHTRSLNKKSVPDSHDDPNVPNWIVKLMEQFEYNNRRQVPSESNDTKAQEYT